MTETRHAQIGDLPLRLGGTLRNAQLAYATWGTLAPDGRNAILCTHGFTSSHLFVADRGWSALVGPGKPIDTDRFFVVSSNMLGSSYGSTAPASLDLDTGRPYGPDFPRITLPDIVAAQKRMLDGLGVKHLAAVIGNSYGGFQAFTWGVEFPDFMRGLVPVETAPKMRAPFDEAGLVAKFSADPNWNGGHYYATGGIAETMTTLRIATLKQYGAEEGLRAKGLDGPAIEAEITRQARAWAAEFDAHSMLALGRAINTYDVTDRLDRIKAKLLYVISRTDVLFPPTLRDWVMPMLAQAGVDAAYHEIDTEHGHMGSGADPDKWAPVLAAFLGALPG